MPPRPWPDLVFHVLAHVAGSAHLPASAYDARYVAWAEQHCGPAAERPLAEDVAVLARALSTHPQLACAQLLAWLFDEPDQALACATRDLGELQPEEVASAELLAPLCRAGPAIEVLRCAVELERSSYGRLPPLAQHVSEEMARLAAAIREVVIAAPALRRCTVMPLRALRQRGRIRDWQIWVGLPGDELELQASHPAWQAAHEATVAEVAEAGSERLSERAVEAVAVVLLAERAADVGLSGAHGRWLAHFGEPAPDTRRTALDEAALPVLELLC